ncbi:MAG: hypothetical protein R6U17_10000 [Thermoplasmata archaeon]
MAVILCEGPTDRIFFHEMTKVYKLNPYSARSTEVKELQRKIADDHFMKNTPLIIYGDNGRPIIYNKVLPRVARSWLFRDGYAKRLLLIIDDDGTDRDTLFKTVNHTLEEYCKNPRKFSELPDYESNNVIKISSDDISFPLEIHFLTVPESLEKQMIKKYCDIQEQNYDTYLKYDTKTAIEKIMDKENIPDIEGFVRRSVLWFKEDEWFRETIQTIENLLS